MSNTNAPAPSAPVAAPTTASSLAPTPPSAPSGNTPAAAPPANQGAAPTPETVNPGAWQAGFNDDLKGYVQNKGFKDPAAVAEAYRNLEKLQGVPQDRLMKLPETIYDDKGQLNPEARAIRERLGAPKDVAGYEIKIPDGKAGDQARLDNFLKVAHDRGISKEDAAALVAADDGYFSQAAERTKEAATQAFNDGNNALKKEWGAAFEANVQSAKEGFRKLGWETATVDKLSSVLGHAETMKMLSQLGRGVGEASFVGGGNNSNRPMEPAAAKAKIGELMRDNSFASKLASGDGDARAMWNRLHEQAYEGQVGV